jgi:hypothetical protein
MSDRNEELPGASATHGPVHAASRLETMSRK